MTSLRVGYDVRMLAVGTPQTGVSRYGAELLRALSRYVDVHAFTDSRHEVPPIEGIRLHVLPSAPYWQQTMLPIALSRSRVDLYHSLAFTLPYTTSVPSVVTVHDLAYILQPWTMEPRVRTYLRRMVRRAVQKADRVIVDTEEVRGDVHRVYKVAIQRIAVVHLGVSAAFLGLADSATSDAALRGPYWLAVGTQEPRKNLVRVVQAFKDLVDTYDEYRDHRLVLIGNSGTDSDRIAAEIRESGVEPRVEVRGFTSDVELVRYYRNAEALVYPSISEGFGLPVIEAMALGCPVVTSRTLGLFEVAGDAAVYVDPNDVRSIAAGMRQAGMERVGRGKAGTRRAELYSWTRAAEATVAVYEKVLSERG